MLCKPLHRHLEFVQMAILRLLTTHHCLVMIDCHQIRLQGCTDICMVLLSEENAHLNILPRTALQLFSGQPYRLPWYAQERLCRRAGTRKMFQSLRYHEIATLILAGLISQLTP